MHLLSVYYSNLSMLIHNYRPYTKYEGRYCFQYVCQSTGGRERRVPPVSGRRSFPRGRERRVPPVSGRRSFPRGRGTPLRSQDRVPLPLTRTRTGVPPPPWPGPGQGTPSPTARTRTWGNPLPPLSCIYIYLGHETNLRVEILPW